MMSEEEAQAAGGSDEIGRGRLREAALGGVRWVTMARGIAEASQLVSMVVLARLISPAQFGYAAIALTVQTLVLASTTLGLGTPLVQRKSLRPEHAAAAQAAVLGLGVVLTILTAGLAPLVVEPALGAETAHLVQLASLLFLISAIGVVPQALLQRKLEFRRISIAESLASVVGASAAVALAFAGLDGAAVVLGVVFTDLAMYGAYFAFARPPLPRWRWREIRELLAVGGPASVASMMRAGFHSVDYVILGIVAGPAAVGYYWRAFQLGVEYQGKISSIMVRIALPVYSRAANIEDLRALRDRIALTNATIIFPLLAILIAAAPAAIPWLFGPGWGPAIVPTQILALAGMCAALLSGIGPVVLAVGKTKALLAWDAASLIIYAGVVYLSAPHGIVPLCIAVTVVYVAQLLVAHAFLLRPMIQIPVRQALYDVVPALLGSIVLLVVATLVSGLLEAADLPPPLTIGATAAVGLAAYLLTLRLLFETAWSDLLLLLDRVVGLERVQKLLTRLARRTKVAAATPLS